MKMCEKYIKQVSDNDRRSCTPLKEFWGRCDWREGRRVFEEDEVAQAHIEKWRGPRAAGERSFPL